MQLQPPAPHRPTALQHFAPYELDRLLCEVESGLKLREDGEQSFAQILERPRQAAGQLLQRCVQLIARAGINYAKDALGLRKIQSSRQERTKRKLPRRRWPSAAPAELINDHRQQRRRTQRVKLCRRLTRVAHVVRPHKQCAGRRKRLGAIGDVDRHPALDPPRRAHQRQIGFIVCRKASRDARQRRRPAHSHDSASRPAPGACDGDDRILDIVWHGRRT